MANKSENKSETLQRRKVRLALFVSAVAILGCDPKQPNATKSTTAESPVVDGVKSSKFAISQIEAETKVLQAMQTGVAEMILASRDDAEGSELKPANYLKADSKVTTFLFSGNNHGERIDCGCKKRPLGGLARRQTLIEDAKSSEKSVREKWWGESQPAEELFVVDSGDVFFKSSMLGKNEPPQKAEAKYDADSVAIGMAGIAYDAVNVGVNDLVFGLDSAKALYKKAGITPISANLHQNGKRVFEPYKIIERGGQKVAFVGLLKEKARDPKYYAELGIEVVSSEKAYNETMLELSKKADLVVLLSNLGISESKSLVENVQFKPNLVIVSSTNRLTKDPEFASGIPVVEPMSRGKYFGRVDLIVNGDEVSFANAQESASELLTRYGRAWRNYLSGRIRYNAAARQLAELNYQIAAREDNVKAEGEDKTSGRPTPKLESEIAKVNKRIEVLAKGRVGSSASLVKESSKVGAIGTQTVKGDDFIATNILPVDIKVPEAKSIKRLIDKRESKRPGSK